MLTLIGFQAASIALPGVFSATNTVLKPKKLSPKTSRKSLQISKEVKDLTDPFEPKNVEEGFGRLDALNRIGNQVFFNELRDSNVDAIQNYAPTDAPVNFPHIWDTSWFNWVQYDTSIMQPMVRNAGEALGVSAKINLIDPERTLFDSSVQVGEIDCDGATARR